MSLLRRAPGAVVLALQLLTTAACATSALPRGTSRDSGVEAGLFPDAGTVPDAGPVDPCYGVPCPERRICREGMCVLDGASCEGVVCPAGQVCVRGGCVPVEVDGDGDGASVGDGDCDDGDPLVSPSASERCNAIDDDCDGAADEGDPGGGAACSTPLPGPCSSGVMRCARGSLACEPLVAPAEETCNGEDDDCDGAIDEGDPGGGGSCSTGGLGLCTAGTLRCSGARLSCEPRAPASETCNGEDDDCDGAIDDGLSGASCTAEAMGECRLGTMQCTPPAGLACVAAAPRSEACDCRDSNCNGQFDDGCRLVVYGVYHPVTHDFMLTGAPGDEGTAGGYVALGPLYALYTNDSPTLGLIRVCRYYSMTRERHFGSASADPEGCLSAGTCVQEGCGWIAREPTCGSLPLAEWVHPEGSRAFTLGTPDPSRPPQAGFTLSGVIGHAWPVPVS